MRTARTGEMYWSSFDFLRKRYVVKSGKMRGCVRVSRPRGARCRRVRGCWRPRSLSFSLSSSPSPLPRGTMADALAPIS